MCAYDEDRCRVAAGDLPHNLATLANVAIALIRRESRFNSIAQGHRHFAHRVQETAKSVLHTA